MKRFTVILLVVFATLVSGCQKEEVKSDKGCLTGVPKGLNYRVLIRCCTQQEYMAGNNVNAGGTSNWTDYTDHKWEAVAKCGDC